MHSRLPYFKDLLIKFINDNLTVDEITQLYLFIKENPETYEQLMMDSPVYRSAIKKAKLLEDGFSDDTARKIKDRILLSTKSAQPEMNRKRSILYRFRYVSWAACMVGLLGIAFYLFVPSKTQNVESEANITPKVVQPPQYHKAMITLSNGQVIPLDSMTNIPLTQAGVQLIKLANGEIAYKITGDKVGSSRQNNTLTNPKGSRIVQLSLADGSQVWLNAGSSLTYPVAFSDSDDRKVELFGEAYFEIAKDRKRKFIVSSNGVQTVVLGTHFNIKSFREESATRVTLFEGSVAVNQSGIHRKLIPGEQARTYLGSLNVSKVNLEEVSAWMNGNFSFGEETNIREVMGQLARWYEFDFEIEDGLNAVVGGEISRNVPLDKVLELLQKTGGIVIKKQGTKIIVTAP